MQLFLDTADVSAIEQRFSSGLISGVTTNPSLIKKSGMNIHDVYNKLVDLGIPDISMEMVADNSADFIRYGIEHHRTYDNQTTIKLPCTPDGLTACKYLTGIGIKVNVTLVFSFSQAILCALAGATYVSPFIGRMTDNNLDGFGLVKDIALFYKLKSIKTKVLAASIRNVRSVDKAFKYGADICTIPVSVYDEMIKHELTDIGNQVFNKDFAEMKAKILA
tara:strand:+ start:2392 stop:3051 length:660 start_codon:yes stop_codon:yes gene_type:complete